MGVSLEGDIMCIGFNNIFNALNGEVNVAEETAYLSVSSTVLGV